MPAREFSVWQGSEKSSLEGVTDTTLESRCHRDKQTSPSQEQHRTWPRNKSTHFKSRHFPAVGRHAALLCSTISASLPLPKARNSSAVVDANSCMPRAMIPVQ